MQYCRLQNEDGTCYEYAESGNDYASTYTPAFQYDGEQCVSAVITTYSPVLIASSMLTGLVAPAVSLLLPLTQTSPPPPGHRIAWFVDIDALWGVRGDNDAVTEMLLETAFTTHFASLSLVLTFGIAAPAVAAAALVSTVGGLLVTLHMLDMRRSFEHPKSLIARAPYGALVIALVPVPAAWACVSYEFLSFWKMSTLSVLVACVVFVWTLLSRHTARRRAFGAAISEQQAEIRSEVNPV